MQVVSATTTITSTPVDLRADIRTLIHQALDLRSMIACSQVSKAWSTEFTPRIWNTIDLDNQPRFSELPSNIIAKNGQYIRIVRTIRKRSEFELFRDPSIQNIEQLVIRIKPKRNCQRQAFQLIQRNLRSLFRLDIRMGQSVTSHPDFALEDIFVSPDPDCMPKLTELRIQYLSMTRKALSTLLSRCPNLTDIDIRSCTFHGDGVGREELYQHKGVTYLFASYQRVFSPDPGSSSDSDNAVVPLLAHFPNLQYWDLWMPDIRLEDSAAESIKNTLKKYNSSVKELSTMQAAGSMVHDLLAKAFKSIEFICLSYEKLSASGILGLLLHKSTLTIVRANNPDIRDWSYYADQVIPVRDTFADAWMIHLIFSRCALLTFVDLPGHEMDMDMIDSFPWACNDLVQLRIRIKGLDTKELIMATIRKWSRGAYTRRRQRRNEEQRQATSKKIDAKPTKDSDGAAEVFETVQVFLTDGDNGKDKDNNIVNGFNNETEAVNPIVDRVATHLLKFEKLNKVWLGYKIWEL
ncbi:hypothetical protein BX616_011201 [Lobosporangium transversale]|uniref:F-box domain-containing protein n=1 Tax=Lobosporangium transversale TaxID=64571 RepID=A0A1Y2GBR2_9FUNG|nr:hypothetical protein BCR41DRAFT_185022 [Lobosporangium transversale]KAF9909391.1 hypothetical protein BX616_011201 [Lobosporangium transversale]ORZ05489.1 hypothetical protein BCR41DRAFT_185022 [Lobosporangium transversale]|eukprot:XP_021877063.1 hypothetical protein BCR41DRAFT_185022 [Lobosporangium transversale]